MSDRSTYEIEAKYTGVSPEAFVQLSESPQIADRFVADAAVTVEDKDVYYDTDGYDLLRRGLALRLRRTTEGVLLTVKSLTVCQEAAEYHRLEEEANIKASGRPPHLEKAPREIRELIKQHVPDGEKLRPILALHQVRYQRTIRASDEQEDMPGAQIAELSLDEVRVVDKLRAERSEAVSGPRKDRVDFRVLELELLPNADLESLRVLAADIAGTYGLDRARESKLEAGLAAQAIDCGNGVQVNIQPDMHMAEACRLIWRKQATEAVLNEHGVRYSDDPEYVHDMRVAVRRARTARDMFGCYFRRKQIDAYFDSWRRLGRLLGRVRDLDVAASSLAEYRRQLDEHAQSQMDVLMNVTQRQRSEHHAELVAWLDGRRHRKLIADFMHFCDTPGMGVKRSLADAYMPQPVQVRHSMPTIILDRFERVRAYESLLDTISDVPYDQLHALRIQCKFLRYVLEFNRHLLGEPGELLIAHLKSMQDHLGELNDYAVEYRRLQQLQVAKSEKLELGNIVDRRMSWLSKRSAELRESFPAAFHAFITADNLKLLGKVLTTM